MSKLDKFSKFNQRKIPACTAHAFVILMQRSWYKTTGEIINFSPRFLDILSCIDDRKINEGRDMRVIAEIASTIGCCTEDLLPNDTTLPISKYRDKSIITEEMIKEAFKYRLNQSSFYDNIEDMDPFTRENEQIEKYLSDFTNRIGVAITIAGIFSAFQFFSTSEANNYFLKFSFPFLLLSIFSYFLSSKRYNFIPSLSNSLSSFAINQILKKVFKRSIFYHKITDVFLVCFFISFVCFYYVNSFFGLPSNKDGFVVVIISLLVGIIRYMFISKNKYSDDPGVYAVGSPAEEFDDLEK
jgi:hypothetical protein